MSTELLIKITSLQGLERLAQELMKQLTFDCTIGLIGQLGAGKTTLVRAMLKSDSAQAANDVSSPSYVLEHVYKLHDGRIIEHWDLYRLNEIEEELLEPPPVDTLRILEWVDKFPDLRNSVELIITLSHSEDPTGEERYLRLDGPLVSGLGLQSSY